MCDQKGFNLLTTRFFALMSLIVYLGIAVTLMGACARYIQVLDRHNIAIGGCYFKRDPILLIFFGFILLCIVVYGIFCLFVDSHIMNIILVALCIGYGVLLLLLGIYFLVSWMSENNTEYVKNWIKQKTFSDLDHFRAFERLQAWERCCGIESFRDYEGIDLGFHRKKKSNYTKDRWGSIKACYEIAKQSLRDYMLRCFTLNDLPKSCCHTPYTVCYSNKGQTFWGRGCRQAISNYIQDMYLALGYLATAFAVAVLLGSFLIRLFAACMYKVYISRRR